MSALTGLVICRLVLTEDVAFLSGHLAWSRLVAAGCCLQAVLLELFAVGFHHDRLKRLRRASLWPA